MKCIYADQEREWRRARLAIDILAGRRGVLTLTPEEHRLLGSALDVKHHQTQEQQLKLMMMQLDLAALQLNALATDIAALNAGAALGIPLDDEDTQP